MTNWKPQHYRRAAAMRGVDAAIVDAAVEIGVAVIGVHPALPPVFSLKHLANLTRTSYLELRHLIERRDEDRAYRRFRLNKRPAPDGRRRFRIICVPEPQLMAAQRWIAKRILSNIPAHSASTAFSRGATLVDAVRPHCGARWLIKVDLFKFFESVSEIDVYKAFRSLGYQPLVSLEMTRLCTTTGGRSVASANKRWRRRAPRFTSKIERYAQPFLGALPQGAPTSPMLANLTMRSADVELTKIAQRFGLTYTRYADDLTFSTSSAAFSRGVATEVLREVYRTVGRFGLMPNFSKTQVIPPRARKVVLGLLADQEVPRLPRDFKSKMRMHLHFLERPDIGPLKHAENRRFSAVAGLRNHLLGLAAFAAQVEPRYGAMLKQRLIAVGWPIVA